MPNMNNCQICGNLVRDPEIKTTSKNAVITMVAENYETTYSGTAPLYE